MDELTDNCENCRYPLCNARLLCSEKAYRKHLGFCSRECYENARKDGFVKMVDWDKFDYKSTRLLEDGVSRIQQHLDKKLANIEWRHEKSQKEDMILEC